ncbi:hypothetical protein QVD17_25863 [Tagetes erecta]|uniref:Uncharacterized protein n=1 Tax=Tagetes erecta TaxID=13708 RepID=A0AAD8NPU1_TARER|nr:hypothetical protein QVD17_25863 [Tagetes erecta]
MKISSKSILSPGRAGVRDTPTTLSTSLSRRLRTSGSVKGGASPAMFTAAAKKRGSFENPEPSSPKVTCIGQVRVRGKKKQAKKLRTLSRRHSSGEVSFRKLDHPLNGFPSKRQNHKESLNLGCQNQNQDSSKSWVHFPVTICEALRAFGSEFSCLIPCRTVKEEKTVVAGDGNRSCGAVFTRWLVAVQDGNGGGERDIELVVGDEEEYEQENEDDEEENVVRRRHVFEDLEIIDGRIVEGHKEEARVSICVPPKNALLLMRCRSDPMKVEALTNRSWEPTVATNEEEDEEFVDCESHIEQDLNQQQQVMVLDQAQDNVQQDEAKHHQEVDNVQQDEANHHQELDNVQQDEANHHQEIDNVQENEVGQNQENDNVQTYEVGQDQEHDNVQQYEVGTNQELDNEQKCEVGPDQEQQEHDNVQQYEAGHYKEDEQTEVEEESFNLASLFEDIVNQDYEIEENVEAHAEDDEVAEIGTEDSTMVTELAEICETHEAKMVNEAKGSEEMLPDCLLMMIHEPKLSLNVSKETWVCSKDFIKRRRKPPAPPPPPINPDGGNELSDGANDVIMVADGGFPAVLQQPARSSCSLPVAPSMATVLEQKLANAVGYEPFVLTRCKSEPMKTAAAKLLPESCVWENRRLERLSRVGFGVGSAGLGF